MLWTSDAARVPAAAFGWEAAACVAVGVWGTKTAPSFVSIEGVVPSSPGRAGWNELVAAEEVVRGEDVVSRAVSVVGRAERGERRGPTTLVMPSLSTQWASRLLPPCIFSTRP
ncbi:hypothetical protein MVI01_59520 [Myxococcus virescens]|uniref:Uncharacterized protein n=1 Tax=Myxococcus virescens TaxID=83456 RepID=A0A511HKR4_9BACT|nr:hypothetical protein MVI01_59520 [Myxococcus virescens]